jgi:glyoxylase-like metal-dependent hydrolase (beta-lactamase superfamily II)
MSDKVRGKDLRHPYRHQLMISGTAPTAMPPLAKEYYGAERHRFRHGGFDVTVFSDGFLTLPAEVVLPDTVAEDRPEILKRLGGTAEAAPFQVNIPLIRAGDDLILVDIGSGTNFQASDGTLAANLKTAGVEPDSVTKVFFTHVHPDHSGATVGPDRKLRYPNADYFVSEAEWLFWMDPDYEAKMPSALHDFARGAQRDLSAVADRLTMVKPGDEIVGGMRVLGTRGHTPGHVSLELEGGDGLVIAGDVVPSNIVFFEHPGWHFGFDTEPDIALKNRQVFLDRAATEKFKMLGCHWAYPGVGYAERKDGAYRFIAGQE